MAAEQLGFDGMPQRLYTCTPSRLNSWLDCPRRYRMTYLDRPAPQKGPPWAHNSVGASAHNALAAWWRLPRPERTVAMAGTLLRRGWLTEGFRDAEQADRWLERTREMVQRYVRDLDPGHEPLGVERTVATRTERIAVSGRIDRLDARGSLALALYALAAARVLRRACHTVELHHLPTGQVAAWEHTDASLRRHLDRAEQIAAEAAEADQAYKSGLPDDRVDTVFPPRPGPQCAWCDFARHCPEGRQAAPRKDPWAALADEVPPPA